MNRADQETLAWTLARSAREFLRPAARTWLCAKIGAGEQESAITDLLVFYANSSADLPGDLAASVRCWIHGYAGTDNEPILWDLYGRINVSPAFLLPSEHLPGVNGPRASSPRISRHYARPWRVGVTGGRS
jgi:hypothetical protein